jgi:hypothetical protein
MRDEALDLDALLHPARAYAHPKDVVHDPDLTLYEKRAVLASWASDACAVDAAPALRQLAQSARPVQFDDVMDALRELDRLAGEPPPGARRRPAGRTLPWEDRGGGAGRTSDHGPAL